MASQTTAAVTGRFVCKLKTQREDESQDKLDECFAIAEQREVGSFIVEIDGNGAVLSGRFGGVGHVASPCGWQSVWMRHGERNVSKHQGGVGARARYHLIRWNLVSATRDRCLAQFAILVFFQGVTPCLP